MPRRGVFLRWGDRDVGTGDELQNLRKFEASVGYNLCVLPLVGSKSLNPHLGSRSWSVLDKSPKELSAGNGHDIDVVLENGNVSGRDWERNLGESGVERFNVDNSILLVVKSESAQQAVNLDIWVGRPDADVVTMLVVNTGTLDAEFQVNAVLFCVDVEELASDGDGSWEGVLGVVDIF